METRLMAVVEVVLLISALAPQFVAYAWLGPVQSLRIDDDWPESGLLPFWERLEAKRYDPAAHPRVRAAWAMMIWGYLSAFLWLLRVAGLI
jgi:hypothetical protein